MRSAEREQLSKKVKTTSHVFAILAGFGILLIIIQFFSSKTGFDFFENISYSISKLFAETPSKKTKYKVFEKIAEQITNTNKEAENTETLEQSRKKAEELLKNQIIVNSITPETPIKEQNQNNKVNPQKFSQINLNSLLKSIIFDETSAEPIYLPKNIKIGVLPDINSIKKSRIALGISLSTGFADCRINYKNSIHSVNNKLFQTENDRNRQNNSLLKYSFGLDLYYRINNKITLNTGLYYTNSGESVLLKEPDENTLCKNYTKANDEFFNGYPDYETPDAEAEYSNVRYSNNISYIEIPLILNYKVKNTSELSDIEFQTGISFSHILYANSVVYNFGNNAYYLISGSNPEVYNIYGINYDIGLIYNKYITDKIQLFANPQCKVWLTNNFSEKYEIKQRNYINSLRLGMKINL